MSFVSFYTRRISKTLGTPVASTVSADIAALRGADDDTLETLSDQIDGLTVGSSTVPAADATTNTITSEVVGNKEDVAQTTVGTTRSLMGYIKGILNTLTSMQIGVQGVTASNTLIKSHDAEKATISATYEVGKTIMILCTGIIRIKFDMRTGLATHTAYAQIYKNGVAFGTEQSNATETYTTKTEDLFFESGDKLDLYIKGSDGFACNIQNLRIYGTLESNFAITL